MHKTDFAWAIIILVFNIACMIYLLSGYCKLRGETADKLAEKEKYIAELEQEIADRDAKILSMTNRASQYEVQIQSLEETIDTLTSARDILSDKCKQLELKVTDLELQLSDVDDLYGEYLSEADRFLIEYQRGGGEIEDIGQWKCTAYCTEKRAHICGTGTGITTSGEQVQAGVSVAVNKHQLSWLPFGTHVYIEGIGERIVMDTGGAVVTNQFDCAVDTHSTALSWSGAGYHRAWILREAE